MCTNRTQEQRSVWSDEKPWSMKPPRLDLVDREQLKAYFQNTWKMSDWLFESIIDDQTLYQNPDPLRHPLIFYLGHTATFYINKLVMSGGLEKGLNPEFEYLFAQGVDPEKPGDLVKREDWPGVEQVRAYRKEAFEVVANWIDETSFTLPITDKDPHWALFMGMEHDRIHFETSSVLIRQYAPELLTRPKGWRYAPANEVQPQFQMIRVPGGTVTLGKETGYPTFGWDNEYGQLKVEVKSFEVTKNLTTNMEYLTFVESGAYQDRAFWSEEGWQWKTDFKAAHPRFWVPTQSGYGYRAMFDVLDMPMDWPVEVNCHEALAYCKWKGEGYRLMTEAEFNHISTPLLSDDDDPMFHNEFNLDMKYGSPCPVGMLKSASSASGINDVYGNVWVWLSNDFYSLPGFKTHHLYENFSQPYLDDRHAMMLGGAWATMGTGASRFYRLWFRRGFYQHAGFRMARDL